MKTFELKATTQKSYYRKAFVLQDASGNVFLQSYDTIVCGIVNGEFENEHGDVLRGRTASDAQCAYGFLNYEDRPREITYHVTRTGNVIFDYIKVLEG